MECLCKLWAMEMPNSWGLFEGIFLKKCAPSWNQIWRIIPKSMDKPRELISGWDILDFETQNTWDSWLDLWSFLTLTLIMLVLECLPLKLCMAKECSRILFLLKRRIWSSCKGCIEEDECFITSMQKMTWRRLKRKSRWMPMTIEGMWNSKKETLRVSKSSYKSLNGQTNTKLIMGHSKSWRKWVKWLTNSFVTI